MGNSKEPICASYESLELDDLEDVAPPTPHLPEAIMEDGRDLLFGGEDALVGML
jgi:hypothetical protein